MVLGVNFLLSSGQAIKPLPDRFSSGMVLLEWIMFSFYVDAYSAACESTAQKREISLQ